LVLQKRREHFIKRELPALFETMNRLGLTMKDLQQYAEKKEKDDEIEPQEE
jgi:hypothetical protein